jgi:hypothetical protein
MRHLRKIKIYKLFWIVYILLIAIGCKKENVPVLITTAVTNITSTSAIIGGIITDEGSGTIIARGVCWSTGTTPVIADNKTIDGKGNGSFKSNLTNLTATTTYYVRAYATNSSGTVYGMPVSFKTLDPSILILNDTIELKQNEISFNYENGISILFDSVLTDSRCPKRVYCFWAGNAAVRFIFSDNNNKTSFILNTLGSNFFRTDSLIGEYRIKLLNLYPYPDRDTIKIKQENYRAEVIIGFI